MAPFRQAGGRLNRSGRTQVDHDVFEGLPIRQWRTSESTIAPPPQIIQITDKNAFPEHPMPRDFHLLPEHSQQLLRAARAGRVSKPTSTSAEDETEHQDEEGENKESFGGFTVKKFSKVARHLEGPEPEYLAKRRKGLPSAHSVHTSIIGQTTNTAMRKTKVKKMDADGNFQIYEVLVPEGQAVEGEIKEEEATVAEPVPAALPGTVVDGVGVVNHEGLVVASDLIQPTPPKRRPPPPKKKKKHGPGRGKKKVIFVPDGEGALGTPGDAQSDSLAVPSTKTEGTPLSGVPSDGDTPMGDVHEGEDDEDEGEEGEDGEEGDEGDEGDEDEDLEDGELPETPAQTTPKEETPAEAPAAIIPPTVQLTSPIKDSAPASFPSPVQAPPISPILPPSGAPATLEVPPLLNRDPSSSPEMPLATEITHSRQNSLTGQAVISPVVAEVPEQIVPMETEEYQPETVLHEEMQAPTLLPEIQSGVIHPEEEATEQMQIDEARPADIEMGDVHAEQLHDSSLPSGEVLPVNLPPVELASAEIPPEIIESHAVQQDAVPDEAAKAEDTPAEANTEAPVQELGMNDIPAESNINIPAEDAPLELTEHKEASPPETEQQQPQPEELHPEEVLPQVSQPDVPQADIPHPEVDQPVELHSDEALQQQSHPDEPQPEAAQLEESQPKQITHDDIPPERPPQEEEANEQPTTLAIDPPSEEPKISQGDIGEVLPAPEQVEEAATVEDTAKDNTAAIDIKPSEGEPDLLGSLERHLDEGKKLE